MGSRIITQHKKGIRGSPGVRKSQTVPQPNDPIWERVHVGGPDDCWEWETGQRANYGGSTAARYVWQLAHGPIQDRPTIQRPHGKLWVLHRCDNPPCCNPRHLFLGTARDNYRDLVERGRQGGRTAPFGDRLQAALGVNGWKPPASWYHWKEWLRDDALEVYRYLRRIVSDQIPRPSTILEFRRAAHVGHDHLRDILRDLEQLKFIKCEWGKLMPTTITVREVPDVPETVERQVKHLPSGIRLDVSQSDINRFLAYWCEKFEQHRHEPYHVVRGRDSKLVHDLLETYGLDELKRLAWFLLHAGVGADVIPWEDVAIPTFALQINRIAMEKKLG